MNTTTIIILVIWSVIGLAVCCSLFNSEDVDFSALSMPVRLVVTFIGGPIVWIVFIYGVLVGLVTVLVMILNRGE